MYPNTPAAAALTADKDEPLQYNLAVKSPEYVITEGFVMVEKITSIAFIEKEPVLVKVVVTTYPEMLQLAGAEVEVDVPLFITFTEQIVEEARRQLITK